MLHLLSSSVKTDFTAVNMLSNLKLLGVPIFCCLLENEIAHKAVEFAHITRATSSADKSPRSHVLWPKENDIVIFL